MKRSRAGQAAEAVAFTRVHSRFIGYCIMK